MAILQLFRRAVEDSRLRDCPDEALLRRFVDVRDATAFETLLRRHGPMVLDVCRGLLPNETDVEDAFQATFLVLAQKAASVRKARSLAAWLHGVAHRVAQRAQTEFARRQKHERRAPERSVPARADDLTWGEIRTVLHQELNALPERLRDPVVLCYLEGMTQDEAAAELGLPKGTLKGRLERGRAQLRARLVRRGLGPAAVLLASAWPVASASAALTESAVKVATGAASGPTAHVHALAAEVLRTMSLAKFRTAAFLAVAAAFCAGACAFALHAAADTPTADRPATERAENPAPQPAPPPKLVWQEGSATIPRQSGPVHALAFSPDGTMLAVAVTKTLLNGEVRGEVLVYDRTNGKELTTLSGFGPVAFSPNGKLLAAREGDNVVRVWEVGKWMPQVALKGLSDTVLCLAFSPDGKFLVAGSGNPSKPNNPGMVRLWDLENGGERATHTHPGAVYGVAFDADGKTFLSASSGAGMVIKSWDGRAGGKPVEAKGVAGGRGGRFLTIAFAPDGKTVAAGIDPVGNTSEMDVKVWDRTTGKELLKPLRHPELTHAVAFAPDGKTLATGSGVLAGETVTGGVARLWDVATGRELADLRGHKSEVRCLAFGPRGRTLATGGWDGTVKLWERGDPEDGKLPAKTEKPDPDRWAKSKDGVIGVRLRARFDPVKVDNAIILIATLRNYSDKPVTVPKPFGGPWSHHLKEVGLTARGPKGELKWKGPEIQPRPIAADDFLELTPGEEVAGEFYITTDEYSNCDCEGAFEVTYKYSDFARYFEGAKDDRELLKALPALKRLWSGAVPAVRLTVTKADPKPPTPEQLEQLKKKLVAALGERFDFVEGRPALKRGERYWLATIRPRRVGEFVLRYVVKYDKPDRWGTDGQAIVYHLVIGKAGAPRVYHLGQFESWVGAYPHACVGDAVTLPVPLDHADNFAEWQFVMPDRVPKREENWFRIIREDAGKEREIKKQPGDIEVRNEAEVFDLVTGTVETHSSRLSRGPTRYTFTGVFEVAKPGKFNIETALTGKKQPEPPRASFEVVPKDQPLSVLINRWDVGATAGEAMGGGSTCVKLSRHPLRVGDRLILFSGEYATTGAEPVKHPRVEVVKKPLDPPPEPFRLMSK